MGKVLLVALYIGIVSGASSQLLRKPVAVAYTEFGSYSLQQADIFSTTGNKASLARVKNISAGLFTERKFMLAEMNSFSAVLGLPTVSGNFGLQANYSGFSDYNESSVGLAYARKLGEKIDAGVQFNYNRINIAGYGNASAVSFEAGIISHLTEKLHAGIRVSNPVGGKYGKEQQEKLPSMYSFGFGYDASEKFFVSAEIRKEENMPVDVVAGLQYKPVKQLLVRAGMMSATSSVWAGAGVMLNRFRIDVVASYHPQLGVTPGLMLLFNINNGKNE